MVVAMGGIAMRGAEPYLKKMFVLSFVLHVAAFAAMLLMPGFSPSKRPGWGGGVYEVSLVSLPPGPKQGEGKAVESARAPSAAKLTAKDPPPTRRIEEEVLKEKPISLAKRTVEKPEPVEAKSKPNPSQLLDNAVSKIETRVKSKDPKEKRTDLLDQTIARLQSKVGNTTAVAGGGGGGGGGGGSEVGIPFRLYQMEVYTLIRSNWSYPSEHLTPEARKAMEAVAVLSVKSDGTILGFTFKTRSPDIKFDQSVVRAIERSNPLPPFPKEYPRVQDEMEITFTLKDLEGT